MESVSTGLVTHLAESLGAGEQSVRLILSLLAGRYILHICIEIIKFDMFEVFAFAVNDGKTRVWDKQ